MAGQSLVANAASWNMPTPYGDGVHHTKNVRAFAEDVNTATGGAIKIKVHSGASLFKHGEIYRSVRGGQAQIGELFMGLKGNDNPIFKADNIPFLASDFDSAKKLWDATRSHVEATLEKDGVKLLYAVPWPPQGRQHHVWLYC
jgi:TRAP-type C4-dicarboxylate transport system substrate-binding protein